MTPTLRPDDADIVSRQQQHYRLLALACTLLRDVAEPLGLARVGGVLSRHRAQLLYRAGCHNAGGDIG